MVVVLSCTLPAIVCQRLSILINRPDNLLRNKGNSIIIAHKTQYSSIYNNNISTERSAKRVLFVTVSSNTVYILQLTLAFGIKAKNTSTCRLLNCLPKRLVGSLRVHIDFSNN